MQEKILITGACGQVGSELTAALREKHGEGAVIATDIREPQDEALKSGGPFQKLDVLDEKSFRDLAAKEKFTQIYHMAALLSAEAEKKPMFGWQLNMEGLLNVLNIARDQQIRQIYYPSSIAIFGPGTPKQNTPQQTIMDPNTVYGISKLAGEGWCNYYFEKYGIDVRGLRYPGLISYKTEPGGGTTDYAVEIFYHAFEDKKFTSFLQEDTTLPMMYMPDAIKATIELMEAPSSQISVRGGYNIAGFSFSPTELASEIRKQTGEFNLNCEPDYRQQIADSWPQSIDDTQARKDWNWKPDFDLTEMTKDMLDNVSKKLNKALS